MSKPIDDQAMIQDAVNGDESALERLLMRNRRQLMRVIERKIPAPLRSFVTVDDVLQEAYLTVFCKIETFVPRGPGSFFRWVATIAENRLVDVIKSEQAAKRGGGRVRAREPVGCHAESAVGWLEMLAVHEKTPSLSIAGRETVEQLLEALGSLKDDYQEALRLRYIEGLPVAETAERMKRSEGAVCLLCHRALKRLQAILGTSTVFRSRGG